MYTLGLSPIIGTNPIDLWWKVKVTRSSQNSENRHKCQNLSQAMVGTRYLIYEVTHIQVITNPYRFGDLDQMSRSQVTWIFRFPAAITWRQLVRIDALDRFLSSFETRLDFCRGFSKMNMKKKSLALTLLEVKSHFSHFCKFPENFER